MTAKSSRRVVIINNIKSDKIEQAIFILRGSNLQKPDRGIIKEAQDIIDDYVRKIGGKVTPPPPPISSRRTKRNRMGAGLLTIMLCAVILCMIFAVRYLMK